MIADIAHVFGAQPVPRRGHGDAHDKTLAGDVLGELLVVFDCAVRAERTMLKGVHASVYCHANRANTVNMDGDLLAKAVRIFGDGSILRLAVLR